MMILKTIAKAPRRFWCHDTASILPMMGAVIIPLLGFVGLATDAARGYVIKTRLHDALDAAGLAAAHEVDNKNFKKQYASYFYANFPQGYMGATVTLEDPNPTPNGQVISYGARAQISTTFMRLLGVDHLNVATFTEVQRQTASLDVVLSIDMSGSMGRGSGRIEDAVVASNTFLDVLYGGQAEKDLLKVGLVPWSSNVNIGRNGETYDHTKTKTVTVPSFPHPTKPGARTEVYFSNVSPVPLLDKPDDKWEGCVLANYTFDDKDNDGDIEVTTGVQGNKAADELHWMGWQPSYPANYCLSQGVTPLQKKESVIRKAVDAMVDPTGKDVVEGSTNMVAGFVWAWRLLAPLAPFEEADVNPKGNHRRAIVILTDGEQTGWKDDTYEGKFGNDSAARPAMNRRLQAVAAKAKGAGIEVYVIQYANSSTSLAEELKKVATKPGPPYYHKADADLTRVFEEIATELSELRLTQ